MLKDNRPRGETSAFREEKNPAPNPFFSCVIKYEQSTLKAVLKYVTKEQDKTETIKTATKKLTKKIRQNITAYYLAL